MSKVPFTKTNYTNPAGAPLASGYVLLRLSEDVVTPDPAQICSGLPVRIELDSNGDMSPVPQVWANSDLQPSGTVYLVTAYTAEGQPSYGPESIVV